MFQVLFVLSGLSLALAQDPSSSWLAYASYTDPKHRPITALNTSWIVPDDPAISFGSNAPGWWFGVQTANGDGALIQPILAYGYTGAHYSIFNGVFDWTDESWHTSKEVYTVSPGDKIVSSVTFRPKDNSYDMYIMSTQTGKSITTNYKIQSKQKAAESQAFFVLEHQPLTCKAYPANGKCTFEDIYVEVDNEPVKDIEWFADSYKPACKSVANILDSKTIKFTWDPNVKDTGTTRNSVKWGEAAQGPISPDHGSDSKFANPFDMMTALSKFRERVRGLPRIKLQ